MNIDFRALGYFIPGYISKLFHYDSGSILGSFTVSTGFILQDCAVFSSTHLPFNSDWFSVVVLETGLETGF